MIYKLQRHVGLLAVSLQSLSCLLIVGYYLLRSLFIVLGLLCVLSTLIKRRYDDDDDGSCQPVGASKKLFYLPFLDLFLTKVFHLR